MNKRNRHQSELSDAYNALIKDHKPNLARHVARSKKHAAVCEKLESKCQSLIADITKHKQEVLEVISEHKSREARILAQYHTERRALVDSIDQKRQACDKKVLAAIAELRQNLQGKEKHLKKIHEALAA